MGCHRPKFEPHKWLASLFEGYCIYNSTLFGVFLVFFLLLPVPLVGLNYLLSSSRQLKRPIMTSHACYWGCWLSWLTIATLF